MLALGIPMFTRIQLPLSKKVPLVGIFSLGIFVILAAVLNKYYSSQTPSATTGSFGTSAKAPQQSSSPISPSSGCCTAECSASEPQPMSQKAKAEARAEELLKFPSDPDQSRRCLRDFILYDLGRCPMIVRWLWDRASRTCARSRLRRPRRAPSGRGVLTTRCRMGLLRPRLPELLTAIGLATSTSRRSFLRLLWRLACCIVRSPSGLLHEGNVNVYSPFCGTFKPLPLTDSFLRRIMFVFAKLINASLSRIAMPIHTSRNDTHVPIFWTHNGTVRSNDQHIAYQTIPNVSWRKASGQHRILFLGRRSQAVRDLVNAANQH
jgi:hypothetical protein